MKRLLRRAACALLICLVLAPVYPTGALALSGESSQTTEISQNADAAQVSDVAQTTGTAASGESSQTSDDAASGESSQTSDDAASGENSQTSDDAASGESSQTSDDAASESDPLFSVDLDQASLEFDYTPPVNSEYALCLFSAGGEAVSGRAEILEDGEAVASGDGEGLLCSAWLVAGATYSVRVSGSGNALVEVARNALSRCFSTPLEAKEGETSKKVIARAYDAHWYRFTADANGRILLFCTPQDENLRLSALLFDASGARIAAFNRLSGGACVLLADTRAGADYFIRIFSPEGETGYYALDLKRGSEGGITTALRFDAQDYALTSGGALDLSAHLTGEALLWSVEDGSVAAVDQNGNVRGLSAGETQITAYGLSSSAQCRIVVSTVALEKAEIVGERLSLSVGDEIDVQVEFTPENASNRRLRYRVDAPEIASVSPAGVLKGLQAGETTLRVFLPSGEEMDSAQIVVSPATTRYRALLVGEQNYPFSVDTERSGSDNSVQALAGLLRSGRFEGAAYSVRSCADLSRAELIAEIRAAFKDATAQDVSLLYITCHGYYAGGMSFLELSDGSDLSARDLERELRSVPGTVVVLIDCCGSGGVIGAASERAAFAKGVSGAFSGAAIRGSKYKVLASAGLDEDSYRVAFNEDADSGVMATVFVRALCDGAGWDIDACARGTMGADRDYDGSVTLDELYLYMRERVDWYLEIASALTGETYRQSVQVYPEGDPFVIFERKTESGG